MLISPASVPPQEPSGDYLRVVLTREAGEERPRYQREFAEHRLRESHVRSSAEVVDYTIRAADGDLGHVEDFPRR